MTNNIKDGYYIIEIKQGGIQQMVEYTGNTSNLFHKFSANEISEMKKRYGNEITDYILKSEAETRKEFIELYGKEAADYLLRN